MENEPNITLQGNAWRAKVCIL